MASLRTWLRLINLALWVAVGYAGGVSSAQGMKTYLETNTPQARAEGGAVERAAPRQSLPLSAFQAILDENVFGAKRSTVRPLAEGGVAALTVPSSGQVTPASLQLTLKGTLLMPGQAFALVAGGDGRNEQVYRRGECVPAGADPPTEECEPSQGKLTRIFPDKIEVFFREQTLVFDLTDGTKGAAGPPPPQAGRPPPQQVTPAQPAALTGNTFPAVREGNTIDMRVPNAEVQKSFENFAEILKQARVVPFSSGSLQGFQIRSIEPGSIFQRIGLQNFDVIKSVNGESITTADQALRLMTIFRNERQIVLEVSRQNQDLKLNYIVE
jgi:type II secretory pathway component PulC